MLAQKKKKKGKKNEFVIVKVEASRFETRVKWIVVRSFFFTNLLALRKV